MKSKRRQELKTNDLAAWLDDVRHSASKWGMYIVIGVAVIVVVVAINSSMKNARMEARTSAYEDLRKASSTQIAKMDKTEDELNSSLATIDELVAGSNDASFKINALFDKANLAASLAQRSMGATGSTDKPTDSAQAKKYLDDARAAYEQVVREFSDRTLFYGRALYGLFQVEALAFVLDGDPAHRAKAATSLEKLRDDPKFNATPLQTIAIEHLKNLDAMFTAVQFPSRPSPSPTAAPMMPIPLQPEAPEAIVPAPTPALDTATPAPDTTSPAPDAGATSDAATDNAPEPDATDAAGTPEPEVAEPQDAAPDGQ